MDICDNPSAARKFDESLSQLLQCSATSLPSSRLTTPRLPNPLRTEESRDSLLAQIAELEAALTHSKARETLVSQSCTKLREELTNKDARLEEREALLETLEQEHRRVKASFRELMDATLNTSVQETSDLENTAECEQSVNSLECSGITQETGCNEANVTTPVSARTEKRRSWFSVFTGTQEPRNSTASEAVGDETVELRQQLLQAQELVETLRGTNSYVQKVLQRNSELEQRCTQLEEGHDERIRELHEELSRARRDRSNAEALVARLNGDLEQSKEQMGTLHRELREMHEKQRLHRVLMHELQDAKEEIESLRDALAAEKTEAQKAAMEWEQEKVLLQADVTFERRKALGVMTPRDHDDNSVAPNILAHHIGELEELLSKSRQELQGKINELQDKQIESQKSLRKITQHLETAQRHEVELQNTVAVLESETATLREQLSAARRDIASLQGENASLTDRALELEEVKTKLQNAQDQVESQTAQINRHLQSIREANERYAELVESKTVLDCLLHTQQKEKEKTIAETVKTHEQLYDQSNSYRQRLEKANREIAELKKRLSESDERLRNAVQAVEVVKLKEIRQMKEHYSQSKRVVACDYEKEMAQMRESYERDIVELRQQKEEKMNDLVTQYETYLKELKSVHEKKLQYVQESKDEALQKLRDELSKRVTDVQALMKERLAKQRALHQEELDTLRSTFHKNLQNQLQQQAKEAEEVRRTLDSLRQDSEERLTIATQKIDELTALLQQHKLRETQSEEQRDASWTEILNERDMLKLTLADVLTKHAEEIKHLEETRRETLDLVQRRLTLTETRLEESQQEAERLQRKLAEVQKEETKLRENLQEHTSRLEREERTEHSICEVSSITAINGDAPNTQYTTTADATTIEDLQESLNLAESATKQLQERLEYETSLLQSQLDAKEERLQSLLKMQQHVAHILARNTELEDSVAKEAQRFSETLQKKNDEFARMEANNSRLEHQLKELEAQVASLRDQLEATDSQSQRLQEMITKEKDAQDTIKLQRIRINELTEKLDEMNIHLHKTTEFEINCLGDDKAGDSENNTDARHRRHLESLRQLADELSVTREENRRLMQEVEELHQSIKESSRMSLEATLLTYRVTAQEETIEMLRERSQNKQAVIDELTAQLRSQEHSEDEATTGHPVTEARRLETKIQELTRRCQQLEDQKLSYEHDRRAAQHRVELEQQLLAQCMEQKERQMRHLVETNKRAEALFARNAELEALIYSLQAERDAHQCSNTLYSGGASFATGMQQELQDATDPKNSSSPIAELDALRLALKEKEERIHKLMEEFRVSKTLYMKEIETLTTRLHFASLEQSLVPLSSEDDLLKLLVEKTTELQKEVMRLQKERDEHYHSVSGSLTRRSSASWRDDEVTHLQNRIETLLAEREALRKQVTQLVSSRDVNRTITSAESGLSDGGFYTTHGLSLRCRLDLILQRYRNAFDLLTAEQGSTAFCLKEMVHLNMEFEAILAEMNDESYTKSSKNETNQGVVVSSDRTSTSDTVITSVETMISTTRQSISSTQSGKYPALDDMPVEVLLPVPDATTSSVTETSSQTAATSCTPETTIDSSSDDGVPSRPREEDENRKPHPAAEKEHRRSKRQRGSLFGSLTKQIKRSSVVNQEPSNLPLDTASKAEQPQ